MSVIALVIGLGIIAYLFLYFAFQLDQEHFLLKILLVFFAISTMILIPKASISDNCNVIVDNTTETVVGNVTTIENDYTTICSDNITQTQRSFLLIPMWFFRIFITYFSLMIFWHWTKRNEKLMDFIKRMVGRR